MKLGSIVILQTPHDNQIDLLGLYGIVEKLYLSDAGTKFIIVRLMKPTVTLRHLYMDCYEYRFKEI